MKLSNDKSKIILYVAGGICLATTIPLLTTDPAWAILPAVLGTAIIVLNRYKKIN